MRVLLDSNVWRYIADNSAGEEIQKGAADSGVEIVVVPALVFETGELMDTPVRKDILQLLSHPAWTRLMPESFLEAEEIKACIKRFRPEWIITYPDTSEVDTLKLDWMRSEDGFWSRAGADIALPATNESMRAKAEHCLAVAESKEIRKRVHIRGDQLPTVSFRHVDGIPPSAVSGCFGTPVEYWRIPSLHCIQQELQVYASPYREWIDYEINVDAILASPDAFTRLWYYQISDTDAPRQWLRGCFEYLQMYHKVTHGNPVDSQLSSHLVDVDVVVSADRNFIKFVEKAKADAPFAVANPRLVRSGADGVKDMLLLLREMEE
jgi:hypothetical protein